MTISMLIKRLVALFTCICLSLGTTGGVWAQTMLTTNDANNFTSASRITLAAVDTAPDAATIASNNLGFDITAPTITHTPPISKGVAGKMQTVVAEISDNQSVERAMLVYRNSSADFFSTVAMAADVTNTTWLATLDTTTDDIMVQYYIVAEDTDGNRVQKGSESNPLTLELQQTELFGSIAPIKKNNKTTWLGIGLGVFVVAALLSSSSGGGGDDDGVVSSDGSNNCCTITFTVPNVSTE